MIKAIFVSLALFVFSTSLVSSEGPVVIIVGTRPEAIKLIPVYEAFKEANIDVKLCSTDQHLDLVNEMFNLFDVKPDYSLNVMKPGQSLSYLTEAICVKTTALFKEISPSLVIVQGDTTTAFISALSAFYCKIPVAHVEAGLRTYNIYSPFPEEMNRQLISRIAALHFTPTALSTSQLKSEGINDSKIYETGNTVVDALYLMVKKIKEGQILPSKEVKEFVDNIKLQKEKFLLLTAHRRESFDGGLETIMLTVKDYLITHPDLNIIYPVHPNPVIKEIIAKTQFDQLPNISIFPPLSYSDLIYILLECDGVLTDSGGIQEEAVSLNKRTLVLRNETDRPEGLNGGVARLVGSNPDLIRQELDLMLEQDVSDNSEFISPYGDGKASLRIVDIVKTFLTREQSF